MRIRNLSARPLDPLAGPLRSWRPSGHRASLIAISSPIWGSGPWMMRIPLDERQRKDTVKWVIKEKAMAHKYRERASSAGAAGGRQALRAQVS
ncbi:Ankyrin Repeat Domain-Containing Protein 11 [Manis pentadactyla]|nr:Ankyrin Repeat Domain-Containing Protein 11 [Manis pentadactyla]